MALSNTSRIRVLEATKAPDGTTRYIDQIVTDADPRIEFSYLSISRLFSFKYDVLHIHWPEVLIRGRNKRTSLIKSAAILAVFTVLGWKRVPIVRTLHNQGPHEPGSSIDRAVLRFIDKKTDYFVTINEITEIPRGVGKYIPHGHYRDRFAHMPRSNPERGRLLSAGLIRPYKGIEDLLVTFEGLADAQARLRIVGSPTAELRDVVESAVNRDPRISALLEFVPDVILVDEVSRAELVCLPYRDLHNSGMLLVALSLDRPVLVPDTPTTRLLASEVGSGWVHFFHGEFTTDSLLEAFAALRSAGRSSRPDMTHRDWPRVARLYGSAFDEALAAVRNGRRADR
ncbi:glycosyl transferase [Leifsonia kafniensis]